MKSTAILLCCFLLTACEQRSQTQEESVVKRTVTARSYQAGYNEGQRYSAGRVKQLIDDGKKDVLIYSSVENQQTKAQVVFGDRLNNGKKGILSDLVKRIVELKDIAFPKREQGEL